MMKTDRLQAGLVIAVCVLMLLIPFGCEKIEPVNQDGNGDDLIAYAEYTCEGCHTNETILQQLAPSEGEPAESGG